MIRAPGDPDSAAPDGLFWRGTVSWREAVARLRDELDRAGIEAAALDARLLAAAALGTDTTGLLVRGDETVAPEAAATLSAFTRQRLAREPVARILGVREFWGLPFRIGPETLEPRPDTETIVEAALERLARTDPVRILDLGTGTGCLLVALLHEHPQAWGLGIDRAPGAARLASANAAANGVGSRAAFLCGDWGRAVAGRFDLVVSNPPYIRAGLIPDLDPEVARHDPRLALDGGRDGLDAYRTIVAELPRLLAPGGTAILEIGFDQAQALRDLAACAGLDVLEVRRDLGGNERAVTLVQRESLA